MKNGIGQDYRGKIVWVGPYLYDRVAAELFERGCRINNYAMSYEQFRELVHSYLRWFWFCSL